MTELGLPIRRVFHQESGQRSGRSSESWTAPTVWLRLSSPGTEICQNTSFTTKVKKKKKKSNNENIEYGAKVHCKCCMSAPIIPTFSQVGIEQLLDDVRARLQFGNDGFLTFSAELWVQVPQACSKHSHVC